MKTFIACLGTETNTFSPIPTGSETFAETMLYRGDATRHEGSLFSGPLLVWRRLTEMRQGSVVESLAAFAQPAGITVRHVYEGFRDEILDDLKAALPLDLVRLGHLRVERLACDGDQARMRDPGAVVAVAGLALLVGADFR